MVGPHFLKNTRSIAIGPLAAIALWASPASAQSPATDKASTVARGEYLAQAGDCVACHTAPGGKLFAGGRAMPTPFGTLYTSNVTPDRDTGHPHRVSPQSSPAPAKRDTSYAGHDECRHNRARV